MSLQRIGLNRAVQYTNASCVPHGTCSMATTEVPLRFARAASAERVHQVRWWGGALIRKFGMRVAADGTWGTPMITSPPFREIGIEPKIARLRYGVAEGGRPATHVKHTVACIDVTRRQPELMARVIEPPRIHEREPTVEAGIERVVALDHRVEEMETAGRFP